MIDVLYFADKAVKQKLFARVTSAKKLTLVTVLPPHRSGATSPKQLEPFASLEKAFGDTLDQVLVVDEGKIEGMWRDPIVDLADALHPTDAKASYAAARGYLFVQGGEARLTVKKSNDYDEDLERLEKAIEKLMLKRKPAAAPPRAAPSRAAPPQAAPPPPRAAPKRTTTREGTAPTLDEAAAPPDAASDPWAVLGVEPGASLAEVKKAWKALIIKYHPDKVAHLAPEFRQLAEEKTRQLMTAWELLRGTALDE